MEDIYLVQTNFLSLFGTYPKLRAQNKNKNYVVISGDELKKLTNQWELQINSHKIYNQSWLKCYGHYTKVQNSEIC